MREGLWARYEALFRAFGWDVVILKYGSLLQAGVPRARRRAPARTGSTAARTSSIRRWCSRAARPGASACIDEIGDQGPVTRLIEARSDDELARLMTNLAGHDLPSLLEAFGKVDHDRPICFISYTIKGFGLPFAGHKDNHAGLMTPAQMESFRAAMNIRRGPRMGQVRGPRHRAGASCRPSSTRVPFAQRARAATRPRASRCRRELPVPIQPVMSTQTGFGAMLNEIGRERQPSSPTRIVTTSPDVTVSTNLGAWVNRRGLFAREAMADTFKSERIPSTFNWEFSPKGQHIELGIAEMNLFILLSALGLSHAINGERLLPIGTLYDPFIARGLDALNYACYQDARFILVATPSGITLAPRRRRAPVDRARR